MELTSDTFFIWAVQHYKNPHCSGIKDFRDDLARIKYVKRLLNKYVKLGDLNERLILNHIILLHNVFGKEATNLLFFKIDRKLWSMLKTFVVYLNYFPEDFNLKGVSGVDIPLDPKIVSVLRQI
jgi:hypothetical protein